MIFHEETFFFKETKEENKEELILTDTIINPNENIQEKHSDHEKLDSESNEYSDPKDTTQNIQERQIENPKQTEENTQKNTRSTREIRKPVKLSDYICYNVTKYLIENHIHYEKFSNKHKTFLIKISEHKEPKNYIQANKQL